MNEVAAIIADLVRAGVDADLVGRTAAALMQSVQVVHDPAAEKRRAWDRDRKAAKKLSTGIPPESAETTGADLSPKKENPQTPKEKTTPFEETVAREFYEVVWPAYPLKRGKRDAFKAFLAARKRASLEIIMAGVRRYAAERAGEDQQYTKHAQGWFSGDHWTDEPAAPRQRQAQAPPPGKRMNPVEAYQSLHSEPFHEPSSAPSPNGNVEFLRPDRAGLPALGGNIRYRPREPDERSNH